jgi:Skp family chaperone for outer membrane proteins
MADEKILRVGTVNLNRLCRLLNEFGEMQSRLDKYKGEREQEMKSREQTVRQAPPAERNTRMSEFNDWRRGQGSEVHQFAVQQREELLGKIKSVIGEMAAEKGIDLVIDSGEVSMVGFPVVLFAREELDMTEEVAHVMNGGA